MYPLKGAGGRDSSAAQPLHWGRSEDRFAEAHHVGNHDHDPSHDLLLPACLQGRLAVHLMRQSRRNAASRTRPADVPPAKLDHLARAGRAEQATAGMSVVAPQDAQDDCQAPGDSAGASGPPLRACSASWGHDRGPSSLAAAPPTAVASTLAQRRHGGAAVMVMEAESVARRNSAAETPPRACRAGQPAAAGIARRRGGRSRSFAGTPVAMTPQKEIAHARARETARGHECVERCFPTPSADDRDAP